MMKNKLWMIKNVEGAFTDEELIALIKRGKLTKDHKIICKDLKEWIKIKDTIYQFYLKEKEVENEDI